MARHTSSERQHHKHSKHRHKHRKHKHHHHHKHGKSRREKKEDGGGKGESPEVMVDERELQTALERLEKEMIEQCGGQSGSSADEDSETLPSIISHTPSPVPPKPHPQESDTLSTQAPSPKHKPLKIHESVITDRKCSAETAAEPAESEARVSSASKVFSERDSDSAEGKKAVESVGEVEKTGGEGGKVLSDASSCEEGASDSDSDFEGFRPIRDFGRKGDKKKEIQIKIRGLEPDKKEQPSSVAATRQESDVKMELEPEATCKTAVDGKSASKTEGGETEGEERGREGGERRRRERGRESSRDNRKKKKKHKKPSKRDGRRSHHSSSRSPSGSRSRSGSRLHSRSHSRSGSRSRRRRYSRSPSRSRRHLRSYSRSRSRSPYHSRSRRHHSRSRSPYHSSKRRRSYSRSRSRSPYRSRGSQLHSTSSSWRRGRYPQSHHRSRSRSPYGRRTRGRARRSYSSRSRSRSRYGRSPKRDKKEDSGSGSEHGDGGWGQTKAEEEKQTVIKTVAAKAKQVHINQFTAFCKNIQKKQKKEEEGGVPEPETEGVAIRAPFQITETPAYQSGLVLHKNVWKTPNQIVTESNSLQEERAVTEQFPVSSGVDHQQKENTYGAAEASQEINVFAQFQPVSMGDLVVKRLEASQRLQQNPADSQAQQMLAYVEHQASTWAGSKMKPGQFTGKRQLNPLTREDHKAGTQAWIKKNMFEGLAPVLSGFGMKMLKKMGWNLGQPLGRMGQGLTEPISMTVKVDRAGLSSVLDKAQQQVVPASAIKATSTTNRSAHLVEGKHPVSALQEICAKKHWDPPHYEMVNSSGPSHNMNFLYRVTLPSGSFQPAVASSNKKQAKVQAALACLQGLGFVENTNCLS